MLPIKVKTASILLDEIKGNQTKNTRQHELFPVHKHDAIHVTVKNGRKKNKQTFSDNSEPGIVMCSNDGTPKGRYKLTSHLSVSIRIENHKGS